MDQGHDTLGRLIETIEEAECAARRIEARAKIMALALYSPDARERERAIFWLGEQGVEVASPAGSAVSAPSVH